MADLTARLLWYRLSESSEHMLLLWDGVAFVIDAGGTVLNYVFVGWLLVGILTIIIVTIMQHHDAVKNPREAYADNICGKCRGGFTRDERRTGLLQTSGSDTALPRIEWLNDMLKWLNGRETLWKGPLLENLLSSMTEESRKLGVSRPAHFESTSLCVY